MNQFDKGYWVGCIVGLITYPLAIYLIESFG